MIPSVMRPSVWSPRPRRLDPDASARRLHKELLACRGADGAMIIVGSDGLVDMLAGAAGVILGQRGRGVPVVILRGVHYERSEAGMPSILHYQAVGCPG